MKSEKQMDVTLDGQGNTQQKAFADALSKVQRTVLQNNEEIILRIEPVDVQVIKATKQIKKEKFLFFFLPRDREIYRLTLVVTIRIALINMSYVTFDLIKQN